VSTAQHEAQERMALLPRYYAWTLRRLEPWIGRRILDVGCGIGNATGRLAGWDRLVLLDVSPSQVEGLRRRYAGVERVEVVLGDVLDPGILRLGVGDFDTVLCLDVLEHLRDEDRALGHFRALLAPGGHLLLKVPAHRWLFGTLDVASGHHRRYTRRDVGALARRAGFEPVWVASMNLSGVAPWWLKGRVLRRRANFSRTFSPRALRRMNRIVPLLERLDRLVPIPLGLSLVAVLRRP